MRNYRKIGIMGGMGPETSAHFYQRMIQLFQEEKGARFNYEFPEMVIHNVPSPDNVVAGVDEELWPFMRDSASLLERAGMSFICIPCNSAHVHIEAVSRAVKIPVMNILEETATHVAGTGLNRVLILATHSTIQHGLYPPVLARQGIECILPNQSEQEIVTRAIMAVCEGNLDDRVCTELTGVIENHPLAQGVLLGCTELPLIIQDQNVDVPLFDTLEILTRAAFERCVAP